MAPRRIAVFGSSEPLPGDPLYTEAYEVGRTLAAARYTVVTGGYGGVMEAASRGARDAGGQAVGVTCSIFVDRRPNAFLSENVTAPDLHARQQLLIDQARGYIVLRGRAGTLSELAMLWALERAGCLGKRPVVLLGGHWRELLEHLESGELLDATSLAATHVARSPHEAVRWIAEREEG